MSTNHHHFGLVPAGALVFWQCAEMEKAIKIAQIQKSIIYADSTGADSSGVDNKVSKALFTHSFPLSGPKK